MKYNSDDVVTTRDGKSHRVLWECKGGLQLYVKCAVSRSKGYMVKVSNVTEHKKRGAKC